MYIFLRKDFKMQKQQLPKILICAPQHSSKMYAFDIWWENVKKFTYPQDRIEVFLADNSDTKENVNYLKNLGITARYVRPNKKGVIMSIRDSHEACRQYAIKHNFDYMLHLETDIIPPIDVITRLLTHKVQVVGGVYDLFFGTKRRPMIQVDENLSKNITEYRTPEFVMQDEEPTYFDGKLKQVYHVGLGCVLIHNSVFRAIEFTADEKVDFHTDTWFANQCFQANVPIFADTTVQCKHYNSTWLGKI